MKRTCSLFHSFNRRRLQPGRCGAALFLAAALLLNVPAAYTIPMNKASAPLAMVAYQDTWADARERWWDIGSYENGGRDYYNQFQDWISSGAPNGKFNYALRAGNVTLIYDQMPGVPYFVGHISARGLKPNFAYQLKLTGKPVSGPRGMGTRTSYVTATSRQKSATPVLHKVLDANENLTPVNGNDWANQQLGYAGRWWNDSNASGNTNAVTDSVYQSNLSDSIYGYLFMGVFVTDKHGNAEKDVFGNRSYHITWQDWQGGSKDVYQGGYSIFGFLDKSAPPHYYGYGSYAPASGNAGRQQNGRPLVKLYYELEPGRPNPVILPLGTYHCRLLITEETFHNLYGATDNILGGKWKTVMATEDFTSGGTPDADASNDIVFTIR